MSKSTVEVINRYKSKLAKTWIRQESFGNKGKTLTSTYQEELEPDGRKRGRAISELCANGYLNMVDGKVQVTIKAFNEVKGSKPDFTKIFDNNPREAPSGFQFEDLHIEAQKYIFDNKGDYQFFYESVYSDKSQIPAEFGVVPSPMPMRHNLMVKDQAFDAARKKYVDNQEFTKLRKTNLSWGLVTLGLLAEADAEVIKNGVGGGLTMYKGFSTDPNGWSAELDAELERTQKRIEDQTRRQAVLSGVKAKMAEYGGWDKFLSEYDQAILAELKKDKTQVEQPAS